MPWTRAAVASVTQSLHTMQCVRFVRGLAIPGYFERHSASCAFQSTAIEAGVKFEQLVFRCSPISNPAAW